MRLLLTLAASLPLLFGPGPIQPQDPSLPVVEPSGSGDTPVGAEQGKAATGGEKKVGTRANGPPDIGHVFIIVLENKDYDQTFGSDSPAPFLAKRLASRGQLLTDYYGTGHFSLGNYITMISGQSENGDTQSDCNTGFKDVTPGTEGPEGQAVGQGCVYPRQFKTIANQLEDEDLTWRGYMEDMGLDRERDNSGHPDRFEKTCAHPPINGEDQTQSAEKKDQYATRHNPFAYFHSLIDGDSCDRNDRPLNQLRDDLRSLKRTRNYSFITPDLCHDGHDDDCVDPHQEGGYRGIDEFLKKWTPRILRSAAFKKDGLLLITFDEAEDDSSACCFIPPGPNTAAQGVNGPGGGRTGTLAISKFIKPGTENDHPYNHYDLLRTTEDIFGLGHLGYAGNDGVESFGSDVFDRASNPRRVKGF